MSDALKILLVDDEQDIIDYLTTVFEEEGFACVGANGPTFGIELANKETFAAIISDMSMPKMTGLEMVPHIRASSHNATTPMLILSGALTDNHLMGLEKLGVIDVMSKPPDLEVLVKIVKKMTLKRIKKAGKSYAPSIVKVFHDSFSNTIKGHLADKVTVSAAEVNTSPLLGIEHCGMVNLYGRRVSGVLTVSFATGFTEEFSKVMLGAPLAPADMEIFESAAGEMVELVAQTAVTALKAELGLQVEAMHASLVHGRFAEIPLSGDHPRIKVTATLNGKNCFLEFALVDMAQVFAGRDDKADFKLLQDA